jgi:hypothetical protein
MRRSTKELLIALLFPPLGAMFSLKYAQEDHIEATDQQLDQELH